MYVALRQTSWYDIMPALHSTLITPINAGGANTATKKELTKLLRTRQPTKGNTGRSNVKIFIQARNVSVILHVRVKHVLDSSQVKHGMGLKI